MKIVVNDANILIDFCKLEILEAFFQLQYDFQVVDAVWEELNTQHQIQLQPFIQEERLAVITEAAEIKDILLIKEERGQLSIPDCTSLLYAKKQQTILLTSDKNLRSTATQHKVEVHGHLWIFDNLVNSGILSGKTAVEKLLNMTAEVNPKLGLPKPELEMRIKNWKQ
ncbi:MAG: hypothetical protein K6A41_04450 [Bacteroidales bacterium]|nr:hypothetical protein [Bacteroidales bacterium]